LRGFIGGGVFYGVYGEFSSGRSGYEKTSGGYLAKFRNLIAKTFDFFIGSF
jgi:hypothetical protein